MIFSTGRSDAPEAGKAGAFFEETVPVNGIREYLLHCPAGPDAPLIVHVHGGPGVPASPLAWLCEAPDRRYGIVYYDQRGSGRTFAANPFAPLSMEALQQDLLETVLYLKRACGKEKVCILGHSFGSVLGGAFALRHPEHVSCFIGCGQMVSFPENERAARPFLEEAVRQRGRMRDRAALRSLKNYPEAASGPGGVLAVARFRALQARFGLARSFGRDALRVLRASPVARPWDPAAFALGGMRSAALMKEFRDMDLRAFGREFRMPVFCVMGENDRTTPAGPARAWFDGIRSPRREWHTVPGAGHFAMIDNPPAWKRILDRIVPYMG